MADITENSSASMSVNATPSTDGKVQVDVTTNLKAEISQRTADAEDFRRREGQSSADSDEGADC